MKLIEVLAAVAAAAVSLSAQASGLTGDTVGTRLFSATGDTGIQPGVVGRGSEGSFFGSQTYNYGAYSFSIRSGGTFCGIFACDGSPVSLELTGLDFSAPITAVTLFTNLSGVSVAHTADSVTFTWDEQTINQGRYLTARFATAVPEPQTYALMLLGLGAIGLARRQSKTKSN